MHNWAENYRFGAERIHQPDSVQAVRRIVEGAAKIRAVGTRHSFNGIADSPGELLDLGAIDPGFVICKERPAVTAGAATPYGVLAAWLQDRGWALHNMASLPHVTLAGAIATGTHGSGSLNGCLSTAVAGLELVTATGELVTTQRGDPDFDGLVVGLGAFGIVTRVTLDIQPSFTVRQDAFSDLPWDAVLADLDAILAAAYSVSLMTVWSGPTVNRLWLKTRLDEDAPGAVSAARWGARPTARASARDIDEAVTGLNPFGGVPGPWSERLPHFRNGAQPGTVEQIQSEYMVPRHRASEALALLRGIGDQIDPHLHLTEVRSVAGDRLWLSPCQGEDRVAVHFTWKREPEAVAAITREIEAMLLPLDARPHWGKLLHARAADVAPLYPRLPAFRALARSWDAGGKFRNAFLQAHVFGADG